MPSDTTPRFIVIENLDIRGARPPFAYTSPTGAAGNYINNAAAIYIEKGENIIVRNCAMHDCGNGFFVASSDALASRDILVESNFIFDNGNASSLFEHNNYTAAIGITFQYNRFGPLRAGCPGNNLKDRSDGLVVRYNWIEGGNRQLDLVDGEDSGLIRNHPQYRTTLVYGNILVEPDAAGNRQITHYGGDSGTTANYRKGTLHFYNNTVVSTRTDRTTLFRLSSNEEFADCRNNIIYVTAAGNTLSMLDDTGRLNLTHNWIKAAWVTSFGGLSGSITNGLEINGATPGFLDELRQNFFLATNSACINAGTNLHGALGSAEAVLRHYLRHQTNSARPNFGRLDLGAYEFSPLQAWRYAHFGLNATNNSVAGDTADPNGNGVPNLLEYAFFQDPNGVTSNGIPVPELVAVAGTNHFAIRFARRVPPSEVAYTVQVSTDLLQWADGSRFLDSGDVAVTSLTSTVGNANTNSVLVRLQQSLSGAPQGFLRVQVRRDP
jgi:hypothetical protein